MSSLGFKDFPQLTGRQTPHHLSEFEGDDEHGRKAVTLAGRVARDAMPWQIATLFAILRMGADGFWTHPDACLIIPRQNGKTLVVILRCLYGLFMLNERIIYSAQRWPTAEDAFKRLDAIIKATPSLNRLVVKRQLSQGKGYIELSTGARILFCTRSNDSGRGFDEVDLIVYDEAYNLTEGETAALGFTQMAAKNPQTIYTSSAVNVEQHINGYVLAGIRRTGLAHGEGMYFAEYMAPEEMDRLDPATWAYANPSHGVIQTDAKIRKLMRGMNTAAGRRSFDVEALGRGIWPKDEDDVEAVISSEVWQPMTNVSPTLVGPIALALDMTPDRKNLAIAASQRTDEGRIHLEVGYYDGPTPGAARYVATLIGKWNPCAVVVDKASPAMTVVADLYKLGFEAETTGVAEMATACGGFYDDAVAQLLDHTGDPLLADALAGAQKRELAGGGAWAWNRKGSNPIAPLVAATLARWGLVTFAELATPPKQTITTERSSRSARSETADLATVGF